MVGRHSRRLVPAFAAAVLAALTAPLLASAAGYSQTAEFAASNGATTDSFGYASALAGDGLTAVVGAPFLNSAAGEAYVFTPSGTTWAQQSTLLGGDTASTDLFGSAAAISSDGTLALIGAPGKSSGTGAVYFFTRTGTTWTQLKELTGSAAATGFGVSVALSSDGSTALVGANLAGSSAGTAYVYARSGSTWNLQQQLAPTTASVAGDQFGESVSLSGDGSTALVGAPGTFPFTVPGTAYAFTRTGTTWTQHQKLGETSPANGDSFGYSVSVSRDGSTAIVGADGVSTGAGAAYVYTTGLTWTQQAKLAPADPASGDQFGEAVTVAGDGNTAVVGAPQKSTFTGAAYVFGRSGSTWTQAQKLTASDANVDRMFGRSVSASMDGSTLLIGNDSKATAGAAYVFALPVPPSPASPTPTGAVMPAMPDAGAGPGTAALPASALIGGGLAVLLLGALAWRRRSTVP